MERGNIRIVMKEGRRPSVEMKLAGNNLLLTKNEIAKLFNVFPQAIEMNLRSIFKSHLLYENDVTYTHRYTKNGIEKQAVYYNLEVIICLSYHIASFEAEVFRQFIRTALQEHLQKKKANNNTQLLWIYQEKQSYISN